MDKHLFIENCPGKAVPITGGEPAFMPNPLPPSWTFPVRIWPLLGEVKQQLGVLEGIGRNLPNPALLLRPLENREALRSSQLEGTYVTARELLLFGFEPAKAKTDDAATNDRREVSNYRRALVEALTSELPLSLRLLKTLHATLLTGVRGNDRTPGEFRRVQVAIGDDHRFVPPPPNALVECLDALEKYFHVKQSGYDPLVDCFLVHYQFETIHPFVDGNGRVGRLLLALMLTNRGGLSKPWLYMSDYYERRRDEYAQRLFNVSASGDWEGWIEFNLQGVLSQAKDTIRRCERLQEVREDFRRRTTATEGHVRLHSIIERLFETPYAGVADIARALGVTYPTAKKDMDRLAQAGILSELKDSRPKTFYASEIYKVAYDDLD